MDLYSTQFAIALLQIIGINIVLSGDNAVVIALACRNLSQRQRRRGIFWGVLGAIGLRVVLTFFAMSLLAYPYLKLIGGALLIWIGIKLIAEDDGGEHKVTASDRLLTAVWTIIIADLVMSLDNVMAVEDPAVQPWLAANAAGVTGAVPLIGFVGVVAVGMWLIRRRKQAAST